MNELATVKTLFILPEIKAFTPKVNLEKLSTAFNKECHINATNDLEAINTWLAKYKSNSKTYDAYKREAERLLLWCVYIRGLTLAQLKVEDFTDYFAFLKLPPKDWCITRRELREGKASPKWRPFLGALNQTGIELATRSLNSMMNFLVTANYVKLNPIKLTSKTKDFKEALEIQKYNVWTRMLEQDEWEAIQKTLENMPEKNEKQIKNKIRTQFLFAMLYFLGLRIHELATHTWNSFRYREGRWYFFVRGKGDKLAHIPVHDKLLSFVKIYRLHLGKNPLPEVDDNDGLLVTNRDKKPLSIRQIFTLVKAVGKVAAKQFPHDPIKQQKLLRLSPHWFRHLLASHLDKAEVPATMIQAILRHSSLEVTNIYMHAEELAKHQELQKLTLKVTPTMQETKPLQEETRVVLTVTLTKGPVCNELSLIKLLDIIENIVFKNIKWHRMEQDREILLAKYKELHTYKQPLLITYLLNNVKEEELNYINLTIYREAEIRLFSCKVEINCGNF